MRIQELATAIFAAPDWLCVASVTVEAEGREPAVVALEDLERYEFPLVPFTLTVDVVPTRNGSSTRA